MFRLSGQLFIISTRNAAILIQMLQQFFSAPPMSIWNERYREMLSVPAPLSESGCGIYC